MLKHLWKIHLPRFHYVVNHWPPQPLCLSSKGQSQPGIKNYTGYFYNWPLFFIQLFKNTLTIHNFFCHTVELAKIEYLILLWLCSPNSKNWDYDEAWFLPRNLNFIYKHLLLHFWETEFFNFLRPLSKWFFKICWK